jgi:hypothetical protein
LVDADEFGLHKNAANHKRGSAMKGLYIIYIQKPGHYDQGDFKLTVKLAVVEPGNPALDY